MSNVNCKFLKDENENIVSPITGINSIFGYSADADKSYNLMDILDLIRIHEISTYDTYSTYYEIPNMSVYRIIIMLYRLHNTNISQSTTIWGYTIIDTVYMNGERLAIDFRWPVGNEGNIWECVDVFKVDTNNSRLERLEHSYEQSYSIVPKVMYGIYSPFYISKIK